MVNYKLKFIFLILLFSIKCSSTQYVQFLDVEPVRFYNDIRPIPSPKSIQYKKFDYYANVLPELPTIKHLQKSTKQYAKDVNSMDEVPASSWYIPRLGYIDISADELVTGPTEMGPPQPPVRVIRVRKREDNPRLFIIDSRHIHYLLKFDPPDFPEIATTTSFIVNRLFWGFGYHVPEDHSFYVRKDEFIIMPESNLTYPDFNEILSRVAPPINGYYRTVASRIIEGYPLGPTPARGVRFDDPNDLFPHEDRRVLRALRVFCAFVNMCDISSDNTLDLYVGADDKGYIKHHVVDFDDAFGTHAVRNNRLWAGFNHIFSVTEIIKNFFTFGFHIKDWEKIENTRWKSVGAFESTVFNPAEWKETHPYLPIRRSQPADDYWAAKIISTLTEKHIEALVQAANYSDPAAEKYMIKTLIERRFKILDHFLNKVTAVEVLDYATNHIRFQNKRILLLKENEKKCSYLIRFLNEKGEKISDTAKVSTSTPFFTIPLTNSLFSQVNNYLCIEIRSCEHTSPSPAQFHFIKRNGDTIHLVGVIH